MVTKEQFKQGMTLEQYLAQMGTNKDKFVEFLQSIKIVPEDKQALEKYGKKLNVLVIAVGDLFNRLVEFWLSGVLRHRVSDHLLNVSVHSRSSL